MKKKGYSRGLAFLILLAFVLVLGLLAIVSSPTGFVSKEVNSNQQNSIIETKSFCSGTCYQGYIFPGKAKAETIRCEFDNKRKPACSCDLPTIPNGAKEVGNPTCTIQYH